MCPLLLHWKCNRRIVSMKIIVATKKAQGTRRSDYSWTTDGEIVVPSTGSSMLGLDSRKFTTTAEVVERNITLSQLADALRGSEKEAWGVVFSPEEDEPAIVTVAASTARV